MAVETIVTIDSPEKRLVEHHHEYTMNSSTPLSQGKKNTPMIDVFPTNTLEVTPVRTPPAGTSTLRRRRHTLNHGTPLYPSDDFEEEKRQDCNSEIRSNESTKRTSPRSPIAVLKLRRSNLFPKDEGTPTNPITVTYKSPSEGAPSRSLASSMFLVSPLRPLTARQRVRAPDHTSVSRDLKRALIDSSRALTRPLSPHQHRPKRSLSDAMLIDEDDEAHEQTKQADIADKLRLVTAQAISAAETQSSKEEKTSKKPWLIPAEHPYKVLWDVLTFVLSFANVYATHTSIRDRQFGNSWFMSLCECWFVLDIFLNFITEYRSESYALKDCRSVWARYLTTWFVVDVLSLFPGEALYLQPIIDQQNRRGFFKKSFFRTKAVVRVTRILRGRHFRVFGQAAKHTKHVGVGANRLLRLLIKYIPKYLLFYRNMKGVVALRLLRQVHWFRKCWRNLRGLENGDNEHPAEPPSLRQVAVDYDEDDDGVPF